MTGLPDVSGPLVDLHTHTGHSDGTFSAAQLVDLARAQGLGAVAVTDHDTVAALPEAMEAGEASGVVVVPGIEISAQFSGGTMHLVGYFPAVEDQSFLSRLEWLQRARERRHPLMLARLAGLGIDLSFHEVRSFAGGGQIGRPHFARALVERGVAPDVQAAFDRYLKRGGPAYVDRERPSPAEGIEFLRTGGGLAVLAHPTSLGCGSEDHLAEVVSGLAGLGLDGLEVYSPAVDETTSRVLTRLARRHDLVITGGSDFHGLNKPGVMLGFGRGTLRVPWSCYRALDERHRSRPA